MSISEIIGATIKINHPQAGAVEASLFIVSSKSPRLKAINLSVWVNLNEMDRAAKLQKWNAAHRFVSVIELLDKIYVEANQKYAAQIQNAQELVIERKDSEGNKTTEVKKGKTIEVKSLTDEESEEFYQSIQHVFTAAVIPPVEDAEEKKVSAPAPSQGKLSAFGINTGITTSVDQILINFKLGFSQIVNKILDTISESNEEDRQQQKRVEERRRIEEQNLKHDILNDDIKSSGIKAEKIKAEEIKKETNPVQ